MVNEDVGKWLIFEIALFESQIKLAAVIKLDFDRNLMLPYRLSSNHNLKQVQEHLLLSSSTCWYTSSVASLYVCRATSKRPWTPDCDMSSSEIKGLRDEPLPLPRTSFDFVCQLEFS